MTTSTTVAAAALVTLVKQHSLSTVLAVSTRHDVVGDHDNYENNDKERRTCRRHRLRRLSLNEQNLVASMTTIRPDKNSKTTTSGGSTGDLSTSDDAGCCLSRSSSSTNHHFGDVVSTSSRRSRTEPATTLGGLETTRRMTVGDEDNDYEDNDTGIGAVSVSSASSPPSSAKSTLACGVAAASMLEETHGGEEERVRVVVGSSSENDDDDDDDSVASNRRRTIIFDDVDSSSPSKSKLVSTSSPHPPSNTPTTTAAKQSETLKQEGQVDVADKQLAAQPTHSQSASSHHVRSSSYLEVASLSSVYSNYSQICADFGGQYTSNNRSGAVSPQPQSQPLPLTQTPSLQHQQSQPAQTPTTARTTPNKPVFSSSSITLVQHTKSNSTSFSTFLGLFGSKTTNKSNEQSQQPPQSPPPSQQPHQQPKSNKFELLTSKLFNLNKPSTSSTTTTASSTSLTKPYSSSSSSSSASPSSPSSPTTAVSSSLSSSDSSTTSSSATATAIAMAKNPLFPHSLHIRHQSNEHYQYNHYHHHHPATMTSSSSVASINEAILASTTTAQVPNTVLIFENRPSNLPAKSQQEALKHRQEYEKMIEIAKRKELKEKELKMKNYQQQIRKEDFMANSLRIWNTEILPNWNEQKTSKRTNQLWWHGLPPPIRGKVWKLAIGNDLNLTEESYYFYEKKAKLKLDVINKCGGEQHQNESAEISQNAAETSSVELIKLDVSRTFPQLCFFQKDGPYHQPLHDVLGAYACYNTKIGYVQGMSFLTAILLLNMEAPDAFICLANLLNNKYLLACFCMDQKKMNRYFRVHQILFEYNLPKLYAHFDEQKVKPDLYLIDWIFTLFSKSLPLDVMSRVWDVFFRDKKEEFLFRTALGILNMYKEALGELDFIHIVKFLTKLPENINASMLFKCIEQIETNVDDLSFQSLIDDCDHV